MELSWTTFILEIINFLVLVWILKRFLYKPVLDVIARRRASIEQSLNDAKKVHAEAEDLQRKYEGRLAEWEEEQQQARESLNEKLEQEHAQQLDALKEELEQEREKSRAAEQRRMEDTRQQIEQTAMEHGGQFATRLLKSTSGPETESRLIELLIAELGQLSEERITALRKHAGDNIESIEVTSAYPLPDDQSQELDQALGSIIHGKPVVHFHQDKTLIAGLQINLGAWVLGLNVRDELKGFMDILHDRR
jgi:F-type H+-transporting ATPase subunit b